MASLVLDIETSGENWSEIDSTTQEILVKRAANLAPNSEVSAEALAEEQLGLSPLTGQIVALGVLDCETDKGAVYYQAPEKSIADEEYQGIKLKVSSEKELLSQFWQLAERYTHFITFNGRQFDLPYLLIRSAVHNIRAGKDLMRGRYLYQQSPNAVHIDLFDQLSFYGSMRIGSLHTVCRAFGITSPKDDGLDGAKVPQYFKEKKYQEIAKYNAADLFATKALYEKWRKLLAF